LAAPVAEAQPYVQRQPVRKADETSWRENGNRRWWWIRVTPLVTIFRLLKTRGAAGAKALLGEVVWGTSGTDPYAGYHWSDPHQRQLCWAQLKREFVAWSERTGETARIGLALLAAEKRLFEQWYRVRDGTLAWADFQVARQPLRAHVKTLLPDGVVGAEAKGQGPVAICSNGKRPCGRLSGSLVWSPQIIPRSARYGEPCCGGDGALVRRVRRAVNSLNVSSPP